MHAAPRYKAGAARIRCHAATASTGDCHLLCGGGAAGAPVTAQAAQPAYMKTNSGRVLEMPKPEEGPTTAEQLAELSGTYQTTVRPAPPAIACDPLVRRPAISPHVETATPDSTGDTLPPRGSSSRLVIPGSAM